MAKKLVYISVGSNLGNSFFYLRKAEAALNKILDNMQNSIVVENDAVLDDNSPKEWDLPYLNMVVRGRYEGDARQLLNDLRNIETDIGKSPDNKKWAPRIIDLDILLFGDESINETDLVVPHREIFNRPFLVHLLAIMDYKIKIPGTSQYIGDVATKLSLQGTKFFNKSYISAPCFAGVINITPDSFSKDGVMDYNNALQKVLDLAKCGCEIIDIGAQSTAPNAVIVTDEEELTRLEPLLKKIDEYAQENNFIFNVSVDSSKTYVIEKILNYKCVKYINTLSCSDLNKEIMQNIAAQGVKIIMTHALTTPADRSIYVANNIDIVEHLLQWGKSQVLYLLECGFAKDDIILDVGIGFGKNHYQSIAILQHIENFKQLGCKLMVGHSRKGFITSYYQSEPQQRDFETISIAYEMYKKDIDYVRIHNVRDHQRIFVSKKFAITTDK